MMSRILIKKQVGESMARVIGVFSKLTKKMVKQK
jgi:hypothetical protein